MEFHSNKLLNDKILKLRGPLLKKNEYIAYMKRTLRLHLRGFYDRFENCMIRTIKIETDEQAGKLQKVFRKLLPELAANALFRLLRKGKIKLNGKTVKDHTALLSAGDIIEVREEDLARQQDGSGALAGEPGKDPFPVLFEDECILAIDKPRGVAVHTGEGISRGTVIDMLKAAKGREYHLGHRLDRFASGILVLARDKETAGLLGKVFRIADKKQLVKKYQAVIFGKPEKSGVIEEPLDGKQAVSSFRLVASRPWNSTTLSWIEVQIDHGRKHQIRRHMSLLGFPLAGDDEYGDWDRNGDFAHDFRIKGYLLHCGNLLFRHPVSEINIALESPLPPIFTELFRQKTNNMEAHKKRSRK
ncbi:MAG: RluA family pseudouridine synthase [Spirochaetaceae bacterium]|nr:MAG: RluA family pseudouridine synthase [Spirochaetaceae bacterium]